LLNNNAGKQPVHESIKDQIRDQIHSGHLPEGSRVPSENELVKQLGVSRNQTRQALRELELEGYVVRRQGSGTFVAQRACEIATMSTPETGAVVMIFPQYVSRYCHRVLEGFMRHMAGAEQHTITYNWQKDPATELRLLRTIGDSGSAGLVAWLEHDNEQIRELVRGLAARRFPIVLVDRRLEEVDVDYVHSDNVEIGYRLTKALIERGHTRIAFAGLFENAPSSLRDRLEGYKRAVAESGIDYDDRLVAVEEERLDMDAAAFVNTYMALAVRPTAFVCINDLIAKRLYDPLVELGFRVPEDVTLAAVQDGRPPERPDVPMITVTQQARETGAQSAAILLERMANPNAPSQQIRLEPSELCDTDTGG
jgi:DNA-binding LacI/PurR family transcriptional regulator